MKKTKEKKSEFEDAVDFLRPKVVDATDSQFHIRRYDGCIEVFAEKYPDGSNPWIGRLPSTWMGWRVIMMICPIGYIDVFFGVNDYEPRIGEINE